MGYEASGQGYLTIKDGADIIELYDKLELFSYRLELGWDLSIKPTNPTALQDSAIEVGEIEDEIEAIVRELSDFMDGKNESDNSGQNIEIDIPFGAYYDKIEEILKTTIPYITEGCIEYAGADDENWRYRFDAKSQKWVQEDAKIVYGLDDFSDEEIKVEFYKRFGRATD